LGTFKDSVRAFIANRQFLLKTQEEQDKDQFNKKRALFSLAYSLKRLAQNSADVTSDESASRN